METLVEGDKKTVPRPGQRVTVHYKGFLPSGAVFDTTLVDGKEASFVVGEGAVIRALDECVQKMSLGQKVKLSAPPEKAYGELGFPPIVPPNSHLTFELELCGVK